MIEVDDLIITVNSSKFGFCRKPPFFQKTSPAFFLEVPHFKINKGENVLLTGPSGSGKSFFVNTLLGLTQQHHLAGGARFYFQGKAMSYPQFRKIAEKEIGIIFQDSITSLHPYRTLEKQSTEPIPPDKFRSFNLCFDDLKDRFPRGLSGGQCQRLAALITLETSRSTIIFDEPVTDIDRISKGAVLEVIKKKFLESQDKTVLYITHRSQELDGVPYSKYMIDNGKICQK